VLADADRLVVGTDHDVFDHRLLADATDVPVPDTQGRPPRSQAPTRRATVTGGTGPTVHLAPS
jgi:hypothetical protein